MTDTPRSVTDLIALFADNTAGDISPQDARDLIESLANGHGEIYVSAAGATTLADTSTWVEVAGTYTLTASARNWAMATNARLNYTGTAARDALATAMISVTSPSNNQVIEWAIALNGTPVTSSVIQRKIGTGADVGALAVQAQVEVSPTDYVCVMVRNITSAANVTAEKMNLVVTDFPEE